MRATICPRVRELGPLAAKRPFEGYLAYPFLPEILPKLPRRHPWARRNVRCDAPTHDRTGDFVCAT